MVVTLARRVESGQIVKDANGHDVEINNDRGNLFWVDMRGNDEMGAVMVCCSPIADERRDRIREIVNIIETENLP